MAGIPPVKPGEPIRADFVNDLTTRINTALGLNPDGTTMEGGKGGRAPTSAAPFREIGLFEISEEFAIAQTDEEDDDKESCVAKLLQLIVSSNTYVASALERTERLYRVSAGADLIPGDHCHAWFNQQSGRWEIIAGGPGGSSSSSEVCRTGLAGIPVWTLPGYEAGVYQFLVKSPDNCIMLVTPGQCDTGGGGSSSSSSSSSSTPSSSSSSEETNDCENCDGSTGGITITLNPGTFWDYGSFGGSYHAPDDYRYGSETPFDLELIGCTATTTFPKLAGPGNQSWQVVKTSSTLLTIVCLDTEDGQFIGTWQMTLTAGSCCPDGTAALVSYYSPTPNDPITVTSSGGPC